MMPSNSAHTHSIHASPDQLRCQGFLLHASAVATPQGALIFTGRSGAGKSTICSLLSSTFEIIADDCVFLRPGATGQWLVADSRHFVEGLKRMEQRRTNLPPIEAPATVVHSLMSLQQDHVNTITQISAVASCDMICNGIIEVISQGGTYNSILMFRLFRRAAQAARELSANSLHFRKDLKILHALKAYLGSDRPR